MSYSLEDLEGIAKGIFAENKDLKMVFAFSDGNIFNEESKNAAELHEKSSKLAMREIVNPDFKAPVQAVSDDVNAGANELNDKEEQKTSPLTPLQGEGNAAASEPAEVLVVEKSPLIPEEGNAAASEPAEVVASKKRNS